MKTIGIIGGLGPPSTVKYYEWLNEGVQKALGGNHSAKIILTSLDGEDVKKFRLSGDATGEGQFYAQEAKKLEQAGAHFILIASNTSHKNVPAIEKAVSIPVLHLADATAARVKSAGIKKIGLLGTAPTMEEDFYKSRLTAAGLDVIIPDEQERRYINNVIYNELVKNIINTTVNAEFTKIAQRLQAAGAQGIILGCTELTLLSLPEVKAPLFDTTKIHVEAALEYALA